MPGALRPSLDLSQKSNVIPSINRRTEATAEDFKELSDIANNHATILDELTQAENRNLFYGIFESKELLEAAFENVQEDGMAIVDPQVGQQIIAKYKNGAWTYQEVTAPIQFYPTKLDRPANGETGIWYIVLDEKKAYLWYGGGWLGIGTDGQNGISAYQVAVAFGFQGTENEWLASLIGKSAYQSAVDNGFQGTEAEWIASLGGIPGKSAYEVAQDEGFQGTVQDWLDSLVGAPGAPGQDGDSAYQIWLDQGNAGTEQDFINSLKGPKGDPGDDASSPIIVTDLPATIPIDGTKTYHVDSGVIKPAISGNVEGKEVEIVCNPADGANLSIDLSDYPLVQLQGGGFTESPAGIFTLDTAAGGGTLKQHLTLMLWRRNNLFISNSMNYRIDPDYNPPSSDPIIALVNVIAYWKEGEGDNTTGTATKTDVKNGKVLTASNYDNPTLTGTEWIFDGVNDGFDINDASINAALNAAEKDFQIHFTGNYKNSSSSRIISASIIPYPANGESSTNFLYKSGSGDLLLSFYDNAPSGQTGNLSLNTGIPISLNMDYLFSLRIHQKDIGFGIQNVADLYVDDGINIQSVTDIDASMIDQMNLNKLMVGLRNIGSNQFYNVGFKSIVIADSSANFNTIRNELAL